MMISKTFFTGCQCFYFLGAIRAHEIYGNKKQTGKKVLTVIKVYKTCRWQNVSNVFLRT